MKKLSILIPAFALMLVGAGCSSGAPSTPPAAPVTPPGAIAPSAPPAPSPDAVVVPAPPQEAPSPAPQPQPSPAPQPAPAAMPATVTYTDAGFSPAVLTVKVGTTVTFSNTASDDMR